MALSASLESVAAWPARMQADMAAAYVGLFDKAGNPDPVAFRRHVKRGLYPAPYKRAGEQCGWLRVELDLALSKMAQMEPEDDEGEYE